MHKKRWIKDWELALLLALCVSLGAGVWAQGAGAALAGRLVRLHVVAVSDDGAEQALKLRVRDSVLAYLAPRLEGVSDAGEAARLIAGELAGVRAAAEAAAEGRAVSVTLGREAYPTRAYEGFVLPAGTYESLRVVLGEGGGRNWWCVVFPPLCLTAAEAEDVVAALDGDLPVLTDGADAGVRLRFRLVELWGQLMALLGQ